MALAALLLWFVALSAAYRVRLLDRLLGLKRPAAEMIGMRVGLTDP